MSDPIFWAGALFGFIATLIGGVMIYVLGTLTEEWKAVDDE